MNCYKTFETRKDGEGNYHTVEVWKPCPKDEPRDALRVNGEKPEVRNCVQVREYVTDYFGGDHCGWRQVWKPFGDAEPDESERGGTVKTNATEGKNNGVRLNPDLLRRYSLVEFGKEVTLFEMIQDPRHHTREWEAVIHILTGTKEYKSEFDERFENFLNRIMD